MIDDTELNELEQRAFAGDLEADHAVRMVTEIRRQRAALRTISAQEILLYPGIATQKVYERLMLAVHVSRTVLGLPPNGEHTTLAGTSGPASNNAAQNPAKGSQPSVSPGQATKQP